MKLARLLPVTLVCLFAVALSAPGCGGDDPSGDPFPFDGGRTDGGGPGGDGICLLNNCDTDRECADCTGDRTVCNQKEHRCIACGASAGGKGCKPGQQCTKYGDCVPNGVTCAEDANGVPTNTCRTTADCAACGPKFRVCDTASSKCVGCLPNVDQTNCQSTDVCKGNTCVAACPKDCKLDADCDSCGVPGKEAHACNNHICSQCSPTKPCANGDACDFVHGVCKKQCGTGARGADKLCTVDGNCAGCQGTTKCKLPVNGGEGTCVAPVNGCSDIGKGVIVLPEPFSRFTNACSNDNDCANVSADVNVGKIVRDVTGIGGIKDANVSYAMNACASVEVLDKSCGVCVPCKQDTDCQDIDVVKLAGDAFGPLGSVGAAILLDKAFGPNDRKIHMYCENVAGDYGACLPCPSILSRCGKGGGDPLPTDGPCHDECTEGASMGLNCGACVAEVCAKDSYCCLKEWDLQCKRNVDLYCTRKTCSPDTCEFREAKWYCFDDRAKGGYRCEGNGGLQVAEGRQCAAGTFCRREDNTAPKSPAILCTTANEPGCDAQNIGKPKCFPTP
jgi:hypothetical protein